MWKPLSIISGLLLLAAGGIMYTQVQYPLRSEEKQAEAAKANLALANENQKQSRKAGETAVNDLADAKTELAANSQKKADTLAIKVTKTAEVAETTTKKEAVAKELAALEAQIKELGGLAQLVAELKQLEAKALSLNANIESSKTTIASTIAHKEAQDKVIASLKLKDIYQRTGTMAENFRTTVSAVNPELGFVVLAHGNTSNVTKGAKLDITRGGAVIAKVNVTRLEPSRSFAEIVPGTLAAGESIQPGDRASVNAGSTPRALASVVNKPSAKPAAEKPGEAPAPDAGAPAPNTAPDPFASPEGAAPPTEKPAAEKPATPPAGEKPATPPAGDAPMAPEKKE